MQEDILIVPARYVNNETAQVDAPPSKSISHRTLVAAGLAKGESRLRGVLESEDTRATSAILHSLGAEIHRDGQEIVVQGLGGKIENKNKETIVCNVYDSGTTCRLLAAVLAAGQGNFRFTGSERMSLRPMQALTSVLSELGTKIFFEDNSGYLPFTIAAEGLQNSEVYVDISRSSQYLSGLLLAAPLGQGLQLIPTAEASGGIVSWSYAQLTLQTLEDFGIEFRVEQREAPGEPWRPASWYGQSPPESGLLRISVDKGEYKPGNYTIEGDFSNASYFLAAGALGKRGVMIGNLNPVSIQGDRVMISIIRRMGGIVNVHGASIEVMPPSVPLQGIEVNMADCPDLVPTVAVMAAFAQGPTRISGVAHLRIKESDRISAPAAELVKTGCEVREFEDGLLIIPPKRLSKPEVAFETYNDHRMAMSMALFSCAGFDVKIKNPACVAKSFPDFWKCWERI